MVELTLCLFSQMELSGKLDNMIELNLTYDQTQALLGLMDQGVRATGLKGAVPAAQLAMIIEAAVQKFHKEQKLIEDVKKSEAGITNGTS